MTRTEYLVGIGGQVYGTRTYDDDGRPVSESYTRTCWRCGGTLHVHRLCDGTGGGEWCEGCGYREDW